MDVTERGVLGITFGPGEGGHGDGDARDPASRAAPPSSADVLLDATTAALRSWLDGRLRPFDLPLDLEGATPFQRRVWDLLGRTPPGSVVTYGEIADRMGGPTVARAVGGAVGANPLPILIPCHRVVRGDGGLGGFTGGLDRKAALLRLEGVDVAGERASSAVRPGVLSLAL